MSHITDALLFNIIRLLELQIQRDGYSGYARSILTQSEQLFHKLPPNIEEIIKKYANIEIQKKPITNEDVNLVATQAKVSLETARRALEKSNGDLAKAILDLAKDGATE